MLILWALGCGSQAQFPAVAPANPCAAGAIPPDEQVLRFDVDGAQRSALVWMPSGPGPHDVIVSLHEFNAEPRRQAYYSHWLDVAREQNAILLGPDGKTATWNAGMCCGKSRERGVDDVAYLDALVARVDAVACTSGNVLATGIGAGGMMAETWACLSDVPDAVVSVGGVLQVDPPCSRTKPLSILHYHGADDKWMPLDGSGGHMSLDHAVDAWKAVDHAAEPTVEAGGDTSCRVLAGDRPMRFCVVAGMKDVWPGGDDALGFEGVDGQPVDATREGWALSRAGWTPR
jgi:polyhydroxybutyrate depolymerase